MNCLRAMPVCSLVNDKGIESTFYKAPRPSARVLTLSHAPTPKQPCIACARGYSELFRRLHRPLPPRHPRMKGRLGRPQPQTTRQLKIKSRWSRGRHPRRERRWIAGRDAPAFGGAGEEGGGVAGERARCTFWRKQYRVV